MREFRAALSSTVVSARRRLDWRSVAPATLVARVALLALTILAVRATVLRGQAPVTASRFGKITGYVEDSLRRGPLANATVIVLETQRTTVTNGTGVFVLDSLEPGEVRLGVRHPLLDTLGLAILSAPVLVIAGKNVYVSVNTATFTSVRERACPRGGVILGPALIFGRILDADTDAPIPGTAVSLVYRDANATNAGDRVRQARARDDGSFAICGLPESITGTLQAQQAARTTAELPIILNNDVLGTAILTFGTPGEKLAVLQGKVTNKAGEPVEGAQVAIAGTQVVGLTRADGTFSLGGLPSGTVEAAVRKIGYAPVSRVVSLTRREPRRITVNLASAQVLAAVHIESKLDGGLDKAGFTNRKKFGAGRFIGPDEVLARHAEQFTDLLQTMPGIRVSSLANGRVIQSARGDGCVNVFIDRAPFQLMQPGDLDQALAMGDVGAVEVYSSANDTPAEFQAVGQSCATIIVWTRTRLGRP
jgi:hypothetical protein